MDVGDDDVLILAPDCNYSGAVCDVLTGGGGATGERQGVFGNSVLST